MVYIVHPNHPVGLQWGRALSSAEIPQDRVYARLEAQLQWGRALSSAEIENPATSEAAAGAALQWGRALSSAEIA